MQILSQLSASSLRILLLAEARNFIDQLDKASLEELQNIQRHMKEIHEILREKEQKDLTPIQWSRNSTRNNTTVNQ
ncbi:hypothetical protein ACQ86N_30075 [Puia sp. P3]|uniref:hypothetical protein n=1 Tax=Puia sp. P3 TaxID=3423952 RepID=UPI003D66E7C9